jgi:hypothetical protein
VKKFNCCTGKPVSSDMFEEGILRLDEVPLNGEVQELPLGFSKYGQELTVVSQKP